MAWNGCVDRSRFTRCRIAKEGGLSRLAGLADRQAPDDRIHGCDPRRRMAGECFCLLPLVGTSCSDWPWGCESVWNWCLVVPDPVLTEAFLGKIEVTESVRSAVSGEHLLVRPLFLHCGCNLVEIQCLKLYKHKLFSALLDSTFRVRVVLVGEDHSFRRRALALSRFRSHHSAGTDRGHLPFASDNHSNRQE